MALNVIFLGPPGAGKGTQADRFAQVKGIPKISTGDILREAVANKTAIGLRAKAIMDRGELVTDEVIIGIVKERLDRPNVAKGIILDGFPRTVAQAQALDGLMAGRSPLIVVDIQVPDAELVRRLTSRLVCGQCGSNAPAGLAAGSPAAAAARCPKCGGSFVQRADDNEMVVRERLKVYEKNTRPLVEFYQKRPSFCPIDGSQSPSRVAEMIEMAVDTFAITAGVGGGAGR
ncbi:MAG: adenylate kinase [Acidimicrobiia bacterium]|nr:adenylate kinase [Acidimicrobiia bacterium]